MDSIFNGNENHDLILNSGIFSNDQLRNILLMRKQYEIKIRRKEKQAFFDYINKEKQLLDQVKAHKKTNEKLEKQFYLRIMRLHKIALSSFKEDLKIWLSYLKFCTEAGDEETVNDIFPLMLKIHTEKRLWHLAAKWEISQNKNTEKALNYLYRGLHFNPKASCLYSQILRLELGDIESNLSDDKQKSAEFKAGNLFEMAKKIFTDLDIYVEMLKISSEYNYTKDLQAKICLFLVDKFKENECCWDLLALRELDGYHLKIDNIIENIEDKNKRIEFCINKYKQAIQMVPTKLMWQKYLNTIVDLYDQNNTNEFVKENLILICEYSHKNSYMVEKHYLVWLECLGDSPKVPEILKVATKTKPEYIQLWVARIRHHFMKKEYNLLEPIFTEAINLLGNNSIQIWRRKLQYYQLKGDGPKNIEKIFRDGLGFSDTISLALQPQFLEWIALFRSRDIVHEVYRELNQRKPFCIELHKKMAELEAMCSKPNEEIFEAIKKCVEENSDEKEVWNEYVSQEIHYGPTWRKEIYKKYLSSK